MPKAIFISAVMAFFTYSTSVFAKTTEPNEQAEFFEMSIEDLMNVEITLASRKQQKLFKTPAAVYVITNEVIRGPGGTLWGSNAVILEEKKKIRFEINLNAARKSKLKIRAKLLRLAARIIEETPEKQKGT